MGRLATTTKCKVCSTDKNDRNKVCSSDYCTLFYNKFLSRDLDFGYSQSVGIMALFYLKDPAVRSAVNNIMSASHTTEKRKGAFKRIIATTQTSHIQKVHANTTLEDIEDMAVLESDRAINKKKIKNEYKRAVRREAKEREQRYFKIKQKIKKRKLTGYITYIRLTRSGQEKLVENKEKLSYEQKKAFKQELLVKAGYLDTIEGLFSLLGVKLASKDYVIHKERTYKGERQ